MSIDKLKIWECSMKIGNLCGCHQRADRSFFYRNWQFPLCARCTGLLLGYLTAPVMRHRYVPDFKLCVIFMLIMLADWLLQYLKILYSTNIRRLITGVLCGYGLMNIILTVVKLLAGVI